MLTVGNFKFPARQISCCVTDPWFPYLCFLVAQTCSAEWSACLWTLNWKGWGRIPVLEYWDTAVLNWSNWGKTREISDHPVSEPWFEARTTCIRRKCCQLQPSVWNVSMYLWTATQIELDLKSGHRSFRTKCSTFLSYFLQPPFWQLPDTACVSNLIVLRQHVLCSVVWIIPSCLQYI